MEASDGRCALRAGGYVDTDGQIVAAGLLVLDGARIAQVGGQLPEGVPVEEYPTAILCPGLIDCWTELGAHGDLCERQHAIQPQILAREAFNRFSRQLRAALAAGVTTFALLPDDQNLVGGQAAICQTAGPGGCPRLLHEAGPLKLSLSPEVFKVDREPTSRMAALGMLRAALEAASAADATGPLSDLVRGQRLGLITTPTAADVLSALQLAEAYHLRLALCHSHDARQVAPLLNGKVAGVIVGPLDLTAGIRRATAAAFFEKQGVLVAIAGGLPAAPADSLRIGAAVAARYGLSPAAARRAITSAPAQLLGISEQVGSLQVGRQADVVVFSGDPLDLRSRPLAVYVAGQRVYAAGQGQAQ